ncbi:RagB/SusD family nutrient uptake outer membrane protein [Sphingobacterium sp. DR205]|uniref:RagB/SusD family nutrient uptake outer membrane protein n=1 Tax=Sphingobacterium sp. DR205 TaxID=2713573 RepID=UPI0013E4F5A4|nr:RagB/SusD family nutrient uptake outer membrane protein [Sphingobacterium sp. DR205]QIH35944.1 hypothetical protein G6053_25060 [Sphingobacterium sp. DR205]
MKKKNIFLLSISALMLFTACEKWLEVTPQNQMTEENLFRSSKGFFDALVGVYSKMRTSYSPGSFFVSGGIDNMANLFYTQELWGSFPISNFDYSNSESDGMMGGAFLNSYSTISSVNSLLTGIQKHGTADVLSTVQRNLVEGESLGIRAFLHFDLLRLWGPIPSKVGTKAYLPYATAVKIDPLTYDTYDVYISKLISDLDRAEMLLRESDPLTKFSNQELNVTSTNLPGYSGLEYMWRQNRFNYYGILALKARVYAWLGDADKSVEYAKKVIEAKNTDGTKKFTLGTAIALSTQDRLLFSEHISSLHINNFDNTLMFGNANSAGGVYNLQMALDPIFPDSRDFRKLNLKLTPPSRFMPIGLYTTRKYEDLNRNNGTGKFSIPLIRLSEMYLIVSEFSPINEANSYFVTYQQSRSVTVVPLLTIENRRNIIRNEYYKEFYAEGQVFFMEKRINSSHLILKPDRQMGEFEYVPPLPSGETGRYDIF